MNEQQKQDLQRYFSEVDGAVAIAKAQADTEGKPLMIIMGEKHAYIHQEQNYLVTESAIIKAGSKHGIKTYQPEFYPIYSNQIAIEPLNNRITNMEWTAPLAQSLGMKVNGFDKPFPHSPVDTVEQINEREAYMKPKLLQTEGSVIVHTGAYHLEALGEDPALNRKFHIVSIDLANPTLLSECKTPLDHLAAERELYNIISPGVTHYTVPKPMEHLQLKAMFETLLSPKEVAAFEKTVGMPDTPAPQATEPAPAMHLPPLNQPASPTPFEAALSKVEAEALHEKMAPFINDRMRNDVMGMAVCAGVLPGDTPKNGG